MVKTAVLIIVAALLAIGLIAGISIYSIIVIQRMFERLRLDWQQERKDLLDRLMARDLPEMKQAQAIENRPEPKVTSRRQNDLKLAELARKAERE